MMSRAAVPVLSGLLLVAVMPPQTLLSQGLSALEGHTCDACHGQHRGTFRPLYDAGEVPAMEIPLDSYGYPLSKEEARCTRCHAASGIGQPRMVAGRMRPGIGDVLGMDFRDDHPIGQWGGGALSAGDFGTDPLSGSSKAWWATRGTGVAAGMDGRVRCSSCHQVHDDPVPDRDPSDYQPACESCHVDPDLMPDYHVGLNCGDCHLSHGGSGDALLTDALETWVCRRCHGAAVAAAVGATGVDIVGVVGNASHSASAGATCSECHAPHGGVR